MAKRGRPRKPSALRVLQGNPGKRPIPGDVNLPPSVPTRPEWLTGRAKKVWTRVTKALRAIGVLHELDREKLAFMCQAVDEAYDLEQRVIQLRKNDALPWAPMPEDEDAERPPRPTGLVFYTSKGFPMPNPILAIRNQAVARFNSMASEFGLSPSARATLLKDAGDEPKGDPLDAFLNETA